MGEGGVGVAAAEGDLGEERMGLRVAGRVVGDGLGGGGGFVGEAEVELAHREVEGVAGILRALEVELVKEREGGLVFAGVAEGDGEVPAVVAVVGDGGRLGAAWGEVHVAERGELVEQRALVVVAERGEVARARTRAGVGLVAGDFFRRDGRGQRGGEDVAVHVGGGGQAEQVQDGGRDVEDGRAGDEGVARDAGASGGKDALRAMPDGDAGGDHRDAGRAAGVAVKAVVGAEDDRRVRARVREEIAQQEVLQTIGGVDHVLIPPELALRHLRAARRVEVHEVVADPVNEVVIDREKVARAAVERGDGGVVDGVKLGEADGELLGPPVFRQVNLRDARDEQPQDVGAHVFGAQAQPGKLVRQLGRVDTAGRERPVRGLRDGAGERLRHADAGDVFRRMRGEPAEDVGGEAVLAEDVPERLAFPLRAGDGGEAAADGVGGGEAEDAVLVGVFAGGDAVPEHRREVGRQAGERAGRAVGDEVGELRQLAGVHERRGDLPVRAVPADEEDAFGGRMGGARDRHQGV